MPNYEDVDWNGLDFSRSDFDAATKVDKDAWKNELAGVDEWFQKMGEKMPKKLVLIRELLEQNF